MTGYQTFPPHQLDQINPARGIVIDVRSDMEYGEKRLACSHVHVPLDTLKPADFMEQHKLDKDSDVYLLCRSGKRAAQAAEKFIAEGYRNVRVIHGGLNACEECGQKVEGYEAGRNTGTCAIKGPISLERQVRIAAGLFTVAGALAALTIHPLFSIIPLFVGSGLVFAGITDHCGMALVLTKAPWNKIDTRKV